MNKQEYSINAQAGKKEQKMLKIMMSVAGIFAMSLALAMPVQAGCKKCGGQKPVTKSATYQADAAGVAANLGVAAAMGKKTNTKSTSLTTKYLAAGGVANVPENGKPTASAFSETVFVTEGSSEAVAEDKTLASAASMEIGAVSTQGSAATIVKK